MEKLYYEAKPYFGFGLGAWAMSGQEFPLVIKFLALFLILACGSFAFLRIKARSRARRHY